MDKNFDFVRITLVDQERKVIINNAKIKKLMDAILLVECNTKGI